MRLLSSLLRLIGWSMAGTVAAWFLFYIIDFILLHGGTGIHLYHQGELLMDSIFHPTDSLSLGPTLYLLIGVLGALFGFLFGIHRIFTMSKQHSLGPKDKAPKDTT